MTRVGIGYDVHRFDESRPLVLGGVTIEAAVGLAGHSDADVVCHAVADAMLGAANLGDLGTYFPDTDEVWRGASSIDLVRTIAGLLAERGYTVSSVDTTLLLETPKIAPHRDAMRANIARALELDPELVSVKATTAEGLGAIGRGEGAACMAVVSLERSAGGSGGAAPPMR